MLSHRTIKAVLFTAMLACIAALAGSAPPPADAHVITPKACAEQALEQARYDEPATVQEWRLLYTRCKANATRHNCTHPRPLVPRGVTVKHVRATTRPGREGRGRQRQVITEVLNVGRTKRAPAKVMVAAIATITQESSAQELRYGHGSSLGPFQIISGWGPAPNRIDATWSARWFFPTAKTINKQRPGLTVGQLSQAVQASAHPTAYNRWVPEAWRTYRRYLGPCSR